MKLTKQEVRALANKIYRELTTKQNEELEALYQEHTNTPEYKQIELGFNELNYSIQECNTVLPENFKVDRVGIKSIWSSIAVNETFRDECLKEYKRWFYNQHSKPIPSNTTLEEDIIIASIDSVDGSQLTQLILDQYVGDLITE